MDRSEAADALLVMLSEVERLEGYPRAGWLRVGVTDPESVAAHSYGVAVVAMWLADHVEASVDVERVLRIALLHDVGEAVTTDLPRPVKALLGRDAVDEAELRAAQAVVGGAEDWGSQVEDYQQQASPEARLVKAADRIQMLAKSLQYDGQHRGDIEEFWGDDLEGGGLPKSIKDRDWSFPLVEAVFERLADCYVEGTWPPRQANSDGSGSAGS